MRGARVLMTCALAASLARAEGVDSGTKAASTDSRLHGAATVVPMGGGLISLGGSTLRYLAPGSRRWETLHRQAGDNLYRVGADDSGRLLAAWEKDPFIHYFEPAAKRHTQLPKPGPPEADISMFQVNSLALSPDGRDALVFMAGIRGNIMRRPSAAYRIALDGKSAPEMLFRVDSGVNLRTSRHGAVYAMPRDGRQRCDETDCLPIAAIVAYEVSGGGVTQKTLLSGEQVQMRGARAVRGSDGERLVVLLELSRGGQGLLRWRHGDADAEYRPLPPPDYSSQPTGMAVIARATDELIELKKRGIDLEIRRYPPEGGQQVSRLPAPQNWDTGLYGLGVRGSGALWVHWGDRLALLDPGQPPRSFNLKAIGGARAEWAGADVPIDSPEGLWVGIEVGSGRDFARVSFADAEKRAQPWPQRPAGCEKLPPVQELMQWRVQGLPACSGGMQNPRAPPRTWPPVVLELPDGTKIVDAREQGCMRVRFEPCHNK